MKEAEKFSDVADFNDAHSSDASKLKILKKMNLDSPLHTTIPNIIPRSNLQTNRVTLNKISIAASSPKYLTLYAGESPYEASGFLTGVQPK